MQHFILSKNQGWLWLLLFVLTGGIVTAQHQHSPVAQQVTQARQNRAVFEPVQLFAPSTERANAAFGDVLSDAVILDFDAAASRTTTENLPDHISLEIPTGQRDRLTLDLVRVEVLTDDFAL